MTAINKNSKIDATYTFANARHWKQIERDRATGVTESQVAEACGWKDARNIQFGNIFNRLHDLGEIELSKDLAQAIKWANKRHG